MHHTLINTNQLRHFGLIVKDDTFATDEPMRIEVEDGEFLMPLQSNGTVIYLDSWTPTDDNLRLLPHVTMSSSHSWNTRYVQFPKTYCRMQEELEMRSIASVSTVHGEYSILISDDESEEDCC